LSFASPSYPSAYGVKRRNTRGGKINRFYGVTSLLMDYDKSLEKHSLNQQSAERETPWGPTIRLCSGSEAPPQEKVISRPQQNPGMKQKGGYEG